MLISSACQEASQILRKKYPPELYSEKETCRARRAFYVQCTHIDNQIRLPSGTLRECSLLDGTVNLLVGDRGDMLSGHRMVANKTAVDGA